MNAGKGDKYRPVNKEKYDNNYDRINWSKWYVYIVECSDGSLYCGCTNDLNNRVKSHNSGKGSKYTASRKPVKLIYNECLNNKSLALKREMEIKKLSRKQKLCLINGLNHKENCHMKRGID